MPPRWLCLLILAAWLLLNGWLFYHDLLPQIFPGQEPILAIDLVEEAQAKRPPTSWTVYHNDREVFTMRMGVEHPRREVFDMTAVYTPYRRQERRPQLLLAANIVGASGRLPDTLVLAFVLADANKHVFTGQTHNESVTLGGGLQVKKMSSVYRVNAEGEFLGLDFHMEGTHRALLPFIEGDFRLGIAGEVEKGTLSPTLTLEAVQGKESRTVPLTGIKVGRRGSVVLPLHPAKRLFNVRRGQSWSTVVMDPMSDFLVAVAGLTDEPRPVRAVVRVQTEPLAWGRWRQVPCLVIDYEGDRAKITTWVRELDGLVVGQKATLGKTTWAVYRH